MKKYLLILFVEIVFTIFMCFVLTWLSVEEISMKYEISKLRKEYAKKKELNLKLKTEKSMLFSPHHLKRVAKSLDMKTFDSARIRKLR